MQIAVLGIGLMGFPMARRLCEAGHTVHAWNRSRGKAERLVPFGATIHATAAAAVKPAEIVVLRPLTSTTETAPPGSPS